ncbi:MAG: PVC-type heme-binding CxxCH protein [Prosthecobacter sp.]
MKRLALLLLAPALSLAAPKPLFQSKVITPNTPSHAVEIDVDVSAAKELYLVVTDGGNGFGADWADWAEPRLVMGDGSEKKLTEVEWKSALSGWGGVRVNSNTQGGQLRSAGSTIEYGIGTHANSVIAYNLPTGARRFKARGVLDEGGAKQGGTSVEFRVYTENPGPIQASAEGGASHEPEHSLDQLEVHPELEVQLFASEPLMLSPASIDIDHRGRVWVCEVVNYRKHNGERAEGDRILILEDTEGDAKADKSTVFHQGPDVNSAHGICVLGNKALISCGDEVFWLIDDNGDDKADRKEVMFTKIGGAQHDHGIHAFHFGPDGRLYFNFGNAGKQLCDKNGELITDIHGVKCTNQNNRPYQQGMVFRCELDGSNVEVLAWNFRNNWEVAVDSFGTMWQSDNDDDGNKGVRINYVMEFGNYGYSDEMTGAGWQTPRLNLETEIPQRHWHQNDPGVVPNVLVTGAGSPTGMQVYEGNLLPSIFHGQPIHCDAGPNVVRAYITQAIGAGYKAEIVNLLEGTKNRWFRPSDVAVAPDGSLIVADWYDPGVGGHGMGDVTRGRLFRVTTKAAPKYQAPSFKLDTVEGAVSALKSPNEEQRYLAWTALNAAGTKAEPALKALFQDERAVPQHRARALWLLTRTEQSRPYTTNGNQTAFTRLSLEEAGEGGDENLRITAIRAARQRWKGTLANHPELHMLIMHTAGTDDAIRREAAIALRFDGSAEADNCWNLLAGDHHGVGRWMLEALGIGADLHWESRLKAPDQNFKDSEKINAAAKLPPVPPIATNALLWRSRTQDTPARIMDWLPQNDAFMKRPPAADSTRFITRPVDFLRTLQLLQTKHPAEVSKAALGIFHHSDVETALAAATLLSRDEINKDLAGKARLDELLKPVIGKPEFISLVQRMNLTGFEKELLDYIVANPNAPESVNAARLIAADVGGAQRFLKGADAASAKALIAALGRVSDRPSVAVMNQHFWNEKREDVRRVLIDSLSLSGEGGRAILKWNSEGKLPAELKDQAALALSRSTDGGVRDQAAKELPLPAAQGLADFPKLPELLKLKGDAAKGQQMYLQAGCVACHRVKGQFVDFGPDLSLIGSKLSAEGLFTAILYPSAAIEHSFIGQQITTKEGQTLLGYAISETDDELTLRIAGGASQPVKKASITKKEEMKQSLMPPGLAATIGAQGLADLVAWLQTLK